MVRGAQHRRSQAGTGLVEALVAVAVVSILLLGVMAGMSTAVGVSRSTGKGSSARNALASVTEKMAAAGWPGCSTPEAINTAMHDPSHDARVVAPEGYGFEITGVASAFPEAATCQTSPATTAVLLTVVVTDEQTGERLEGDVVVRNRAARPQ